MFKLDICMWLLVYIRLLLAWTLCRTIIYHPISTIIIYIRKFVPLPLVEASTPSRKGATNQGRDQVVFPQRCKKQFSRLQWVGVTLASPMYSSTNVETHSWISFVTKNIWYTSYSICFEMINVHKSLWKLIVINSPPIRYLSKEYCQEHISISTNFKPVINLNF